MNETRIFRALDELRSSVKGDLLTKSDGKRFRQACEIWNQDIGERAGRVCIGETALQSTEFRLPCALFAVFPVSALLYFFCFYAICVSTHGRCAAMHSVCSKTRSFCVCHGRWSFSRWLVEFFKNQFFTKTTQALPFKTMRL